MWGSWIAYGSLATLRPPSRLIWIGTEKVSRPSLALTISGFILDLRRKALVEGVKEPFDFLTFPVWRAAEDAIRPTSWVP
jgi:hypothetical protein